jgi:CHASE1-domain containing sensor protein
MPLLTTLKPHRLTVVLCLLITALIDQQLTRSRYDKARLDFDYHASDLIQNLQQRLDVYSQALTATQALFNASDTVTANAFSRFVQSLQLDSRFPGLHDIGYSPYLTAQQLPAHIKAQQAAGFSGYNVHPSGIREAYAPLQYLQPYNPLTAGLDSLSHPICRDARFSARDSGQITLSGPVKLLDDNTQQTSVLLIAPLFDPDCACDSVAQRQQQLRGWLDATLQLAPFIQSLRTPHQAEEIALSIFDGDASTPEQLLLYSDNNGAVFAHAAFTSQQQLTLANRTWLVQQFSTPALEASLNSHYRYLCWAVGLLLTGLLSGLAYLRQHNRHQLQMLSNLGANVPAFVAYFDNKLICRYANDAYYHWLNTTANAVLNQPIHSLFAQDLHNNCLQCPDLMLICADNQRIEKCLVKADGSSGHLLLQYVVDNPQQPKGLFVIGTDISDLQAAQLAKAAQQPPPPPLTTK